MTRKIVKTDAEWRQQLSPDQYAVLRQQATERPFSGKYVHAKADGVLCLRRLRARALLIRNQVQFVLRLAQLF